LNLHLPFTWLTQKQNAADDAPVAAGGDLSVPSLLAAYRQGIFPWFNEGASAPLWWSPDPRLVLFPEEFHCARSLAKTLRRGAYEIRMDGAFAEVISACAGVARRGQAGTWITADMKDAYIALHLAGYAHSVETWREGELAGGLYGVAIGRVFYGESMFARQTDASKVALARLVAFLREKNFGLIDCQMKTRHLASLGAREIPRAFFYRLLAQWTAEESALPPGSWERAASFGREAG
jgi:leucyl/phenylalanyl-tRNA--protein transferase